MGRNRCTIGVFYKKYGPINNNNTNISNDTVNINVHVKLYEVSRNIWKILLDKGLPPWEVYGLYNHIGNDTDYLLMDSIPVMHDYIIDREYKMKKMGYNMRKMEANLRKKNESDLRVKVRI